MNPIHIIIIDDHMLVREAWGMILNKDPRFLVVAQSGDAEQGIEFCRQHRPEIVLLDINLPGMSGMDAVPLIRKFAPCTKIIGVSLHTQVAYVRKMMQSGASGYITKNSHKEEMIEALIEVYEGRKYICKEIKDILAVGMMGEETEERNVNALSIREIQIIDLVRKGFSSKEIARAISISVKTVEVHRYNILKKLHLKNAAALVNFMNQCDFSLPSKHVQLTN
jgi:two-component system invasion response regulator UvrY